MQKHTPALHYTFFNTPIGQLLLAGLAETIHFVGFPEGRMAIQPPTHWQQNDEILQQCQIQLQAYFNGQRTSFDLNLSLEGTDFQRQVWQQLQQIPFGKTCSYKDIAQAIQRPKSVRAVGAANGRNPIPIIIPCHRVIGTDGSLTGFGGGLVTKRILLKLEGALVA